MTNSPDRAIAKRMYAGINSLQFTSSAIDQRTAAIHHDTRGIRDDLARVVVEIEALRDLVIGGDGRGIPVGQQRTMEWVDRYVVSASSYAETVCDDIEWSDEEYQTMLETLTVISGPSSGPPAGPGRMRATGVQFASKAAEKSSPSPAPPPRREIAGLSEDLVACLESAVRRRGTGVLTGDASDLMFEISGHCAAFVPHGRTTMLAVNGDGHIAFHDARTGYLLAAAVVEDLTTTTSSRPPQFSPDGSLFALVVDSGGALYVNDSPRSRPGTAGYTGLANQQIYETGTLPAFVAFSMNNRLMVSGSINGSIDVWERKRGEPRFKKKGRFAFKLAKSRVVHELAVSPCGKFVVAAIIPNEFGVNRPASGIAIQIYSLAKNKFGRLVGEPYREDAESSYSFLHFHHWDGELVASLWYCPLNCNMHGLSLLDVDPQAKTLRFSKRAPPDDIDFKTFVEHYDGATRRDLTNIGKAAGRYCVAFCMDEQQRDEEAVHIYQWDRDWGRTSAGDARTNLRCPSFSSDLSLLLVQAVGGATSSYEVWLLPTQFE